MTDERPEQNSVEIDVEELEVPYTQRVYTFLQSLEDRDEREPVFYLYKYDHPTSGKGKSFIDKFTNDDPPEQHEIGEQYGGGRYLVIMVIPPRRGKDDGATRSYTFKLHARFDDVAKKNTVALPSVPTPQYNPINDMLAILERIIGIASPFIIPLLSRPKDENVSAMMAQMYSSANDLLRSSMADNFRMVRDLKNELRDQGTGEIEDMTINEAVTEPVKADFMPMIMNLLSDWLPKLINGNPVETAALSQVVRATPQFQQLMADRGELERIISFLVQTQGAEDTNKLLKILKVNKQVPVPPPAATMQSPTVPTVPKRPARGKK